MRKFGIVIAWLVATTLSIAAAAAAVGGVRDAVTDAPRASLVITTAVAAELSPETVDSTIGDESPTSTTVAPAPSTTTTSLPPPGETTTTTTSAISGQTTTTAPTTTTTTASPTTTTSPPETITYSLVGGQVTISAADPNVWLVAAVPAAGFAVDVEKSGPEKVEVEFKSEGQESSFNAEFEDGALAVEIDDHHDD